ncbi:hypothetical protein MKEN_00857300 [Mycena kentingensis (nom. inval.)]|nr:hypothetical protein MKEN_00857300 [Mycena kentingensis (nom. inval.)]
MALLLAPYNDAMRLGMGFNSFTQQLCINDAVRLADGKDGIPATDNHLRPIYKQGQMTAADGGNVDISQDVVWTAKFVDRISEVTDSLNVSGSLQIKVDALGGGGKASASFIDTNKFKESDINYLIQVKVTNQRLPVKHIPDSEFTRVYGDSFISGFTEGGEFNALISIKLKDRSAVKQIKGGLEIELNLKAAQISGKADVDKQDLSSSIDGETTISVSWKGGGDIKNGDVSDWTLQTLKAVAMEFPEHVMACPMRTNAILTKYTALKSFYELSVKASPLEYENAGVYSSALLDAYMDYKVMWRDIQQGAFPHPSLPPPAESIVAAWEVEQGQSMLTVKSDIPEFAEMAIEAKTDFTNRTQDYQRKVQSRKALSAPLDAAASVPVEGDGTSPAPDAVVPLSTPSPSISSPSGVLVAPMPPNELKPYNATIFGLDKARRDCRFEMIKIVREVDAVADDPQVACDPTRLYQYLSPAVFRMLVPTVTNLSKQRAAELAAEEAKKVEEDEAKAKAALSDDLTSSKRDIVSLKDENEALKKSKAELEALAAKVNPYNAWAPFALNTPIRIRSASNKKSIDYDHSEGKGSKIFHQCETLLNPNQKFEIVSIGPKAFAIRHVVTGRYITTQGPRQLGVYLGMGDFPYPFSFERLVDNQGNPNRKVMIHFAEQNEYTFNIEGGAGSPSDKVIGWAGGKSASDEWYIRAFDEITLLDV